MSSHSELGPMIRASVTIPWSAIQPPKGQALDLDRMANQIRLAWCALLPEIERGSRVLWDLTSIREVQLMLCSSHPQFYRTELWGDMNRMWATFRGYVANSLVYMADLNMACRHGHRTLRTLLDMLESLPDEDLLDPLEDAEEDRP